MSISGFRMDSKTIRHCFSLPAVSLRLKNITHTVVNNIVKSFV